MPGVRVRSVPIPYRKKILKCRAPSTLALKKYNPRDRAAHDRRWATDGTRESFDVREFVEPWPLSSDCLPPDGELSARATELQRAVKAWQEKSSLAVRYLDAGTLNGHVS